MRLSGGPGGGGVGVGTTGEKGRKWKVKGQKDSINNNMRCWEGPSDNTVGRAPLFVSWQSPICHDNGDASVPRASVLLPQTKHLPAVGSIPFAGTSSFLPVDEV